MQPRAILQIRPINGEVPELRAAVRPPILRPVVLLQAEVRIIAAAAVHPAAEALTAAVEAPAVVEAVRDPAAEAEADRAAVDDVN